ncbi:MAG: hypothetical protein Q8Q01_03940 [archaeon]|nr:hypothetical protein [archaeon]
MIKMKVQLFRRGKLVGLVSPKYYFDEEQKIEAFWEDLELPKIS